MIWFTSDAHLDHKNIIKYCNRPFKDVEEMNSTLIKNYNDLVKDEDTVFILGDLAMGKMGLSYWLDTLKGHKYYIFGSHEKGINNIAIPKTRVTKQHIDGIIFFMVHNPNDSILGKEARGLTYEWMVHGHVHNSDLVKYPFFNEKEGRINVSVDVTDFKPVSLDNIKIMIQSVKE